MSINRDQCLYFKPGMQEAMKFSASLGYIQACLNPFIYAAIFCVQIIYIFSNFKNFQFLKIVIMTDDFRRDVFRFMGYENYTPKSTDPGVNKTKLTPLERSKLTDEGIVVSKPAAEEENKLLSTKI